MNLFQVLATSVLLLHSGTAQFFPISNLRAFFDHKTKQPKDNHKEQGPGRLNTTRPHLQSEKPKVILPSLQDFDAPDIHSINRDIESQRQYPGPVNKVKKRYPTSPVPKTSTISARRKNSSRYRARVEPPEVFKYEESPVFITPRPNFDQSQVGSDDGPAYSQVSPNPISRTRVKHLQIQELEPETLPVDFGTFPPPRQDDIASIPDYQDSPVQQSVEVNLPPDELGSIENVPDYGVSSVEQDQPEANAGLVDYLTPPIHPSVYEKARKRQKSRNRSAVISKRKPPPPKKDIRYRSKKNRQGELKPGSTNVPLERQPLSKRHTLSRRRPPLPRPVRKPSPEQLKELELHKQGALMDEQITAETGFTGATAGAHAPSHHGGERVEFQLHGQKGPQSYKFGYDTGKGHNRQFRYEEKDNHGRVIGHYGYYDKQGKLQVVNYEADPHQGFKAEPI